MTLYPPNYKNRKFPKQINFTTWDIETDYPFNPKKILLLGFYNGKDYKEWDYDNYGEQIFDYFLGECLKKKYYGYNHYAHFGGKFDFLYMLETLKNYNYNIDFIDINGRILELIVYKSESSKLKGKVFHFRDSFAIMPKSLQSITHSFNIEHPKLYQNFNEKEKDDNNNYFSCLKHHEKNCLKCYTMYDVLGLYESLKTFENIINSKNGEIKLTIASIAMDVYKNGYLKTILNSLNELKIGKNVKNEDIILNTEEMIRNYYFGGRTEIFKRYCEYQFLYDVNSLYPFVMLQNMPISAPIFALPENINLERDIGFVYAEIEFWNEKAIPIIPYKLKLKYTKKLVYPLGKWSGWIDLDLYRKAKKLGYKFNIHHGIIFNSEKIFKDYILDFYSLRNNNEAMNLIAKLLMNSLYGKFAQKRERKMIIKYLGLDEKILSTLIPFNLDENLYQKETISKSKHIIPSISAHITTLAQLELYKLFEKCNGNITYCDTDSVITSEKLTTGKNLGEVKLEYEIDKGIFLLPKSYFLQGFDVKQNKHDEKITLKGFIKNQFTFQNFYDAVFNNDLSAFNYRINKIWGYKESMNRNKTFLTYDEKINSIKTGYDKRIILEDKIHTKPLTINDNIVI